MTTLTVTYSRRLPVFDGGPEEWCEVAMVRWLAPGWDLNEICARLEDVRAELHRS